jgi:hypothetical protein
MNVFREDNTKQINTNCMQNEEFSILNQVVHVEPTGFKETIITFFYENIAT